MLCKLLYDAIRDPAIVLTTAVCAGVVGILMGYWPTGTAIGVVIFSGLALGLLLATRRR